MNSHNTNIFPPLSMKVISMGMTMAVVACTHQTCKSNCNEYGIFFVPSVCQSYCGSRMEGHSCIRTKVLAEDLFRWYSTNVQTYSIQGMKRCTRILRSIRRSMEHVTLVLSNVTIISREFPICYIWMKKNHEEEKDQALHWKYDAIKATFE